MFLIDCFFVFQKYPNNLEKAAELAVSSLQVGHCFQLHPYLNYMKIWWFLSTCYFVKQLQAVLSRTLKDYEEAGYDPQTSSLEIRLIQSQDDIRNPEIKYNSELYD